MGLILPLRRPGNRLCTLFLVGFLLLSSCVDDPVVGEFGDAVAAYGWQRCDVIVSTVDGGGSETYVQRNAAIFDPETGKGRFVRAVGEQVDIYALNNGEVSNLTGGPYVNPLRLEEVDFSLAPFRNHHSTMELFDFSRSRADLYDPGTPPTEEYRMLVEAPMVISIPLGDGDMTERIEGLPGSWPNQFELDGSDWRAIRYLSEYASAPWILDIWPDNDSANGSVSRLRFQTQVGEWSPRHESVEIRFLPVKEMFEGDALRIPECELEPDESDDDWLGFEPWNTTRTSPLVATFDEQGRPFDTEIRGSTSFRRDHLATLAVPSGRLLVMDGNTVQVRPGSEIDVAPLVVVKPDRISDAGVHDINIDALWNVYDDGESVMGIWIGPTDAPVERWGMFEDAYGTDGGVGGIIAETAARRDRDLDPSERESDTFLPWEELDFAANTQLFDTDDVEGADALVFGNGIGDGFYPMSRGYDDAGEVVVVVVWHVAYPWRLAIPVGTPPPDVSERENQLLECFRGERTVLPSGSCSPRP